jgi:site-specific DNA-methyltransferase (adenine-specific)
MLNQIHHGDCREVIRELEDNSIDLVVTSPPYNVGVDYGEYDDKIPMEEYQDMIDELFKVLSWKVKNSGRVCVNVSLKNERGIVDIPSIVKNKADAFGWNLRFEIIWNKGSSESSTAWGSWLSPSSPRPIFNHEYIFVFDVGEENKDSEQTIEKERFMNIVKSVWDVNPETSSPHPAPFPKEIARRLIELNSYKRDTVLDPFIGSGTTAVVAEEMNRDWIGIDVDKKYIEMSYDRIENETTKMFDDRSVFDY